MEELTSVDGVNDKYVDQRVGPVFSGYEHPDFVESEMLDLLNPVRLFCSVMMSVPVSSRSITTAAPKAADVIH